MNQFEKSRGEKIINFFYEKIKLVNELSKKEVEDLMEMISFVLADNHVDKQLKSKALTVLYDIAYRSDTLFEELWQIYWIITNQLFTNSNIALLKGNVDELYNHIFSSLQEYLKLDYPYIKSNERNKEVIVIITSQFLGFNHSPTKRVLDYSYAIQRELKKKVFIINDSGFNFYRSRHLRNTFSPNFMGEYSHIDKMYYKDEEFAFYQVDSQMPNINIIENLIKVIYEIAPLFIFNIGASSLVTDLCSTFITTASLPCSYDIPVSRSKYLLVGRKLNRNDGGRIRRIEPNQRIIETEINYVMSESIECYNRAQFGLSEDSFVISIIGNRLDDEISIEFLKLLNKIVSATNVELLFIGEINDIDRIKNDIIHKERIHFTGYISEASEALKISDIYLNPERNGGGRSSFEALHYGVPVITLEVGDVYYTSGKEFSVSNYDEMYNLISKYYIDSIFYQEMKKKSINRARKISNIAETQKKMIDDIMKEEEKDYE